MLALTENMSEIVKKLAEEVPETSGLRIAAEADGQSLSVSPPGQPNRILDGGVDEQGNIQFALGQQT